jgi:tRNA A-37 threonylcarbamoyl transferase component Bud32
VSSIVFLFQIYILYLTLHFDCCLLCGLDGQVLIDFGLGYNSTLPEDKAVDLYVLERACIAMHSSVGDFVSIHFSFIS